jgi:TfoX/Sxy family transcriptional regulator of competence genes
MAHNLQLADRVREALVGLGTVEEKRMFGGLCFMVNGKMCVTVGDHKDHVMMVRIDPILLTEALSRRGARTVTMNGRKYKGYVFVQEEGIKSKRDFDYWMRLASDFNKKAKASRKRNKKLAPKSNLETSNPDVRLCGSQSLHLRFRVVVLSAPDDRHRSSRDEYRSHQISLGKTQLN